MNEPPVDIWNNCYPSNWKGLIPFGSHPAKFSSRLIDRIYDHLSADGVFANPGVVVDPFAGIATGGLAANKRGIDWIGVEVESGNVLDGQNNLYYWRKRFGPHFAKWGNSDEVLGDSQFLTSAVKRVSFKYKRVAAIISSPPFLQTTGGTGANVENKTGKSIDKRLLKRHAAGNAAAGYGDARGQIASRPGTDFDDITAFLRSGGKLADRPESYYDGKPGFWISAARILEQVRAICDKNTRIVWVLKGYVKNREYIDFPAQWRELSELSGLETVHIHHANFTKNVASQLTIDGDSVDRSTTSKSFFRRIVEEKYDLPKIDFESVICQFPYRQLLEKDYTKI
jgi:hypothetical protein